MNGARQPGLEGAVRIGGVIAIGVACLFATPPAHGAGLLVADGGFGGVLAIKEHTVEVTINNGIAVTQVSQVFLNTENRQVEALYTFPVPAGASVANFSMWINGEEMVGEVLEKERAREIYNSYKERRRDPGLLEQADFKTFEMRIFPIAPNAEQRVQISYYQELDHDFDWATYIYPLATSSRSGVDARVQGRFALSLRVLSEVPIVAMESPSHPDDFIFVEQSDALFEASLELPEGSLGRDIVVGYNLSRPKTGLDIIASRQAGEDGFFCMTITAGEDLEKAVGGMDYVFVLDISGSMGDERKLETSSNSIAAFIDALGEEDRFEVMTFNVEPNALFGQLMAVDNEALGQARTFLDTQRARGGTVLQPAMSTAYKYADPAGDRPLNVVLLSDGLTEQRDRPALLQVIGARPRNTRVFCVGVGNDVDKALLQQIAEDAGGLAALISQQSNFERQARAFRRKLTRPVATSLTVEFVGAEVYDVVPARLPNLYHGTPVRVYGRYRDAGPVDVQVRADLNGYGLDQSIGFDLPQKDDNNPEIDRMWAWNRVQELQKEADRAGSRAPVVDEIVRLGEAFSIVTEYTSFLVLENNAEYKRWKIERRNALRIERDRAAQNRLREQLDAIRNARLDGLGPIAAEQKKEQLAQASAPTTPAAPRNTPGQNRNFDTSNPGWGGGAIDPLSGGIVLGLAALGAAARRKRNRS